MNKRFRVSARKLAQDPPLAPAIVLCVSFIGFGALCQSVNFGLSAASFTTLFVFALPAQVILVDHFARDTSIAGAALTVTFTAVRLLPMTVALLPHLQLEPKRRWIAFAASHFVAVTVWIEAMRRLPELPHKLRLSYYLLLAALMIGVSLVGTLIGYWLAHYLPKSVGAGLIFLTPIYFAIGLLRNAQIKADHYPVALGFLLAPVFAYLTPGFDLAVTGLIVGSINYFVVRRRKSKPGRVRTLRAPAPPRPPV